MKYLKIFEDFTSGITLQLIKDGKIQRYNIYHNGNNIGYIDIRPNPEQIVIEYVTIYDKYKGNGFLSKTLLEVKNNIEEYNNGVNPKTMKLIAINKVSYNGIIKAFGEPYKIDGNVEDLSDDIENTYDIVTLIYK